MVVNRIMTTKQKKFLEKTFGCLGISIEDFMEVNNIIEFRKQMENEIKSLRSENMFLAEVNTKQNEVITILRQEIYELHQKLDDLFLMKDVEAE